MQPRTCLRRALNDRRRRYEYHLERTGKRFELERQAKVKAEKEAHVRLHRAAPDLLDALRDLLAEAKSWGDDVRLAPAVLAKAEAALAKATGALDKPRS
jgi:hypothetical protein